MAAKKKSQKKKKVDAVAAEASQEQESAVQQESAVREDGSSSTTTTTESTKLRGQRSVVSVVKQFNAETGRTGKPRVTRLHGVAEQVGGVECGYYVMQFMKEIVNDETLSFPTKWAGKKRKPYDQSKIDEVRLEVADYIQALL